MRGFPHAEPASPICDVPHASLARTRLSFEAHVPLYGRCTMPHLEFGQTSRPLGPGVLTIGSAPEAGWRILDYDLAPIHAMITLERDGHAHLSRPSLRARILVNGEEMLDPTCQLAFDDVVTLGRARLT